MAARLEDPQDRGAFFKALGTLMAGFVAMRVEEVVTEAGPRLLRPPGALDEFDFLLACTRCDKCVQACPTQSILRSGPQAALAAGTPQIQARNMPCFLCTALPCITACPEGALVWPKRKVGNAVLEGPPAVKMGTARVKRRLCLTYERVDEAAQPCTTCVDRCPYPGSAIRMVEGAPGELPHPEVVPDVCTGCGLCTFGCPAPQAAIVVDPGE
jgi:MauM/NapG family ferredoxin protein